MSDEGDAANDAASDGGDTQDDSRGSGGRTALVTKAASRPQRPTGKRSRQKLVDSEDAEPSADDKESSAEDADAKGDSKTSKAKKAGSKAAKAKAGRGKKAKKKPGAGSANPIVFVYNYLKQVVAEMRKVIWPNRRQMITYTSVVLAFLAFMVALVGLADYGLTKLVMLVFG
ncbi:MAG: preprotein translocase subunit SecE [Mycobacterium sp.]|uniref:preprotein translocase subunit SecE n=1 Tax=Mycobacterium sp. TaxID=1785 RepID=UPI001ED473B8|nr:preprotein translocase subunit SecE [Mycobacterium sp.]MBW0020035.1 preprotein translocase subunit SecE [Mycobacterium sp.]